MTVAITISSCLAFSHMQKLLSTGGSAALNFPGCTQEAEEAREESAAEFRAEVLRLGQESAAMKEQIGLLQQGIAAHRDAITGLKLVLIVLGPQSM